MNALRWLLLALVGFGVALGKSYRLEKVEQDVYLQADGLTRVVDTRTFAFEGTYREVFFNIEPSRGGLVQYQGAKALDAGPMIYKVEGNRLSITAGPPDDQGNLPPLATDESRTFAFSYLIGNELQVATDAALFDRQVLEPVHAPIASYVLRLHAPKPVPERFRVFIFTGRGRIGSLEFDPKKQVATVQLAPVSENEFVRSKVILAARVFNRTTLSAPRFEQWLNETAAETRRFREQSRRATAPVAAWVAWLSLIPIGLFGLLFSGVLRAYWQGGREPKVEDLGRYYREPAEPIAPGLVPYVLHQTDPGRGQLGTAFSATLLEMARAGNLELVRHHNPGVFGLFGREETRFRLIKAPTEGAFAMRVYQVLYSADSGDGSVSPEELKRYFQKSGNTGLVNQLANIPRQEYESKHGHLLDPVSGQHGTGWAIGLGIGGFILLLAGFFAVPLGMGLLGKSSNEGIDPLVMLAIALGLTGFGLWVLAAVAYRSLPRWQADKLLNARRWAAYRRFLADFSQMEQAPPEHFKLWDYHFVYAAALGVAERYLRNLRNLAQTRQQDMVMPRWVGVGTEDLSRTVASVNEINLVAESLEQVTRNLNNLESALNPRSSGAGGGFGGSSVGGSSGGGSSSGAR